MFGDRIIMATRKLCHRAKTMCSREWQAGYWLITIQQACWSLAPLGPLGFLIIGNLFQILLLYGLDPQRDFQKQARKLTL